MNAPAPAPRAARFRSILLLVAALAALVALGVWLAPYLSRDRVETWVRHAGAWGPIALLGVQAAQILLAPIPGGFVPILAGALYGPLWGPILTSIGTLLGSTGAYWIGRAAGGGPVERWVGPEALRKAHALISGKRWLALIPIFLVPFSPADAVCFVAGIVAVPWGQFMIAVLVGRLPRDAAIAVGTGLGVAALGSNG